MKYIDTEKLIAEIERLKKNNGMDGRPSNVAEMIYSHILSIITSLQQEQQVLAETEERLSQPMIIPNIPAIPTIPYGLMCDGTHCTNPHHDCINCPIKTTGGIISTNTAF